MFLMGQHLATAAQSDAPVPPMPARVSAWAIYDQFTTLDGQAVFLGITSDGHWQRFCRVFDRPDLADDAGLATNSQRIEARPRLLPAVAEMIAGLTLAALSEKAVAAALPFAPIARPEALFDDPHLKAGGYLLDTALPDGGSARLPALPISLGGRMPRLRRSPPRLGADTAPSLASLGFDETEIAALVEDGVVGLCDPPPAEGE
jgi:crotonobetainyl-CoA:carnitine CoA-transferase CaiB-like acyl-CoA transferase